MKRVLLIFSEEEHEFLLTKKGEKTWEKFVLGMAKEKKGDE